MNKLSLTAVLCLLSFAMSSSVFALNDNSKTQKVVVSQFSEFEEIKEHLPEFQNSEELLTFLQTDVNSDTPIKLQIVKNFIENNRESNTDLNLIFLSQAELFLNNQNYREGQLTLARVNTEVLLDLDLVRWFWLKALVSLHKNDLFNAEEQLVLGFQQAKEANTSKWQNTIALKLAALFFELNDKESAQLWLGHVDTSFKSTDDLANWLETASQLAELHSKLNNLDNAANVLNAVLADLTVNNFESLIASVQLQLAEVYLDSMALSQARSLYEKVFVYAQQMRNSQQQMQAMSGLMRIALAEDRPWQADKVLNQANKLEPYIFDVKTKLEFWQVKAQVLAAKGRFRSALNILKEYELWVLKDNSVDQVAPLALLDDKLTWLTQSGQSKQALSTFDAYQQLAQRVAALTANRKIDFIQKNYAEHKSQTEIQKQQTANQISELKTEQAIQQKRIWALYIVIVLIVVAAAMSLWWLYKKFTFEKGQSSLIDPITQAYNHRFLSRQYTYLKHHKYRMSLILFNLDKIAELNKRFGHEVTDHLMFQMVARLKLRLLKNTWLVRDSGNGFVVLANNFDHKQAFILAEILRKELNSKEFQFGQQKVKLRASFAAAECLPEDDLESVKLRLNLGVEQAKMQGGDKTWRS